MKNSFLLSLLFLVSFNTFTFSETKISSLDELVPAIDKELWIDSSFNQEELQLLANVIFFSIYRAQTQQSCRFYVNALATFAILAEKHANSGFSTDYLEIEGLEIAVENLRALQPITKKVIAIHERLVDDLMRSSNKRVPEILTLCAQHAGMIVTSASNEKREDVLKLLSKAENRYADQAQKLNGLAASFKALKTTIEEKKNNHIAFAVENVQHEILATLDECLHQLHSGKNQFNALSFELENNGIDLFKLYYNIIYDGMKKREYDSNSFQLLVSAQEQEDIQFSKLPDPVQLKDTK